jgi:hypothetical protein
MRSAETRRALLKTWVASARTDLYYNKKTFNLRGSNIFPRDRVAREPFPLGLERDRGMTFLIVLVLMFLNGLRSCSLPELGRGLVFLGLCIPLRLLAVAFADEIPAAVYAMIGGGFLYQYANGKDTGFFGGKVWWPRAFHAATYTAAAVASATGGSPALFLAIDVTAALVLRLLNSCP